jgi:RNA polymerase sigma-70 factor (ECF subfamily)
LVQLDEGILKSLKDRDPTILAGLFNELNPYLLKMAGARRILGEQAEELVCRTWETFFENIESFQGRSEVKSFLGGILINKIREERRYQDRYEPEEDPEKIFSHSFSPEGWWKRPPPDPAQLLSRKQTRTAIEDCLEGLSSNQKEAFLLREVEGEDSASICNILDVSITNLGVLLFRAKEKLRQCLEGKIHLEGY